MSKKRINTRVYNEQNIEEMTDFLKKDLLSNHQVELKVIGTKIDKKSVIKAYEFSLKYPAEKRWYRGEIKKHTHIIFRKNSRLVMEDEIPGDMEKIIRKSIWDYINKYDYSQG